MTFLVKYNSETTIVGGYFEKGKQYFANIVDEQNKTIDGEPYIEIEKNAQFSEKKMCVINGVYQEYVTPDSVLLEQAKTTKIAQLKANRISEMEVKTPKPSSLQVYEIDGVFRTFKLKISDIAILNSRIIRLQNAIAGTTAQWTDIDNNRLDLNLDQFKTLANHLDVRDQNLFTLYIEKLAEINACTTLEELNNINIDFS